MKGNDDSKIKASGKRTRRLKDDNLEKVHSPANENDDDFKYPGTITFIEVLESIKYSMLSQRQRRENWRGRMIQRSKLKVRDLRHVSSLIISSILEKRRSKKVHSPTNEDGNFKGQGIKFIRC